MKKKIVLTLSAVVLASQLLACGSSSTGETTAANAGAQGASTGVEAQEENTEAVDIKIGATPSPHAEILEFAKDKLAEEGVNIEIVEYNDYVQPNNAVDDGTIDANFFQHYPYLENFNEENGTNVVSIGNVHYEPFGIYAGKSDDLSDIADGAQIAVPNDTTNEARALLLLEANGIIELKEGAGLTATKQDIVENPYNVEILEVEAAQIPRSVQDVDFACMNGNYAIQAGFKPSDAIAQEDAESEAAKTYANIVAVAEANQDADWANKLIEVLQSDEVVAFITEEYEGGVIAIQ